MYPRNQPWRRTCTRSQPLHLIYPCLDLPLEYERLVAIFTPLAEHFQSVRQFVADLKTIAVRIVKINALLAHMINGLYLLDTWSCSIK